MKRFSLFKFGLILSIFGVLWIAGIFFESEKVLKNFELSPSQTIRLEIQLQDTGIGYYRILIPEFEGDTLFIQILDPSENILVDKIIETKMAVNYFDFKFDGIYVLKATNLSENLKFVEFELGDTNSSEMRIPGIFLGIGLILMIVSTFKKLNNYRTAQPEEKIS